MSTENISIDAARRRIEELVERFSANLDSYKSHGYNETQARNEFINPFFEALGWDMYNRSGYAEAYKDVIHEDAIKIGGLTKAPDYCFRIGGQRKFFVEAKKPFINLRSDPAPYFQLRRYAFSSKLPLSILTDFEELAILDCRSKPSQNDKASAGRVAFYNFEEYPDKMEEIFATFSKEAVLKGSFDRYVSSSKAKRGTGEVDKEFLKEIEGWRDLLARNIALRNPGLSQRDLNYVVQATIDRLIFLRICEDRGIEEYGVLQGLQNGSNVYLRLCQLFQNADDRYNSGLFHFRKEKGRPSHDELSLSLAIDDKPLKEILRALYYPESPYEFSVLPVDILGQVYEQFLGKLIRLTAGHRAVVEDKPEVKKAGGVYYTPTYIVDYIVKNTVGKLLEGKTPKQTEKLRILDPACGSGSFLIGAYEYLMDWHRDWYTDNKPEKWAAGKNPRLFQGKAGWQLTTPEKKRILLNNIYGVDIDPQAVEVTKLSLLLKVLEEENAETIGKNLSLFHERALPDLRSNIKCGNSLIGSDFYEGQQLGLLNEEERYRINAFNWEDEFPEIIKAGGFDAVIGNPPYVRIQNLKEWAPIEVEIYKGKYMAARKGNYDIYLVFVERGLGLLNKAGRLGFILPSKFLTTDYGQNLRKLLSEMNVIDALVDFGHGQVFQNATTYTCLLFLDMSRPNNIRYELAEPNHLMEKQEVIILSAKLLGEAVWTFVDDKTKALLEKLDTGSKRLLDLPAAMSRGTSTGADHIFCLNETDGTYFSRDGNEVKIEPEILRQPLYATDFTRYNFRPRNSEHLIFPYTVGSSGYSLFDEIELKEHWPMAYRYLLANKDKLEQRKQFRSWFGYSAPRNLNVHECADLLVPLLADRGLAAPITNNLKYCVMASAGFSIRLLNEDKSLNEKYLLGLINSKLLFWKLKSISNKFRGGWITCTKQYFGELPIREINFSDPADKSRHDQMVALVNRMLDLNKQLQSAKTGHAKTTLQRQIDATDRQIDRLVYELYDLTDDEIKIVEGSKTIETKTLKEKRMNQSL
ncbi:MAG: N-6 DNA methylase [Thermoleophilia bacterium]|nr:N-6 DNA methylase [Thermoleophilia bacterium]